MKAGKRHETLKSETKYSLLLASLPGHGQHLVLPLVYLERHLEVVFVTMPNLICLATQLLFLHSCFQIGKTGTMGLVTCHPST